MAELLKIGEVAERAGLTLRTIRFYEEEGLLAPAARTTGGFRQYSDGVVARLDLIRTMKPLGFTVEEIRTVLAAVDGLAEPSPPSAERSVLADVVREYSEHAEARAAELLAKVSRGRDLARHLREVADAS